MKVGFDPSAGQVNQQSRKCHLGKGDRMPRKLFAGLSQDQANWKSSNCCAKKNRREQMWTDRTLVSLPHAWRKYKREQNSSDPFDAKQSRKHAVSLLRQLCIGLREKV